MKANELAKSLIGQTREVALEKQRQHTRFTLQQVDSVDETAGIINVSAADGRAGRTGVTPLAGVQIESGAPTVILGSTRDDTSVAIGQSGWQTT